MREGCLESVRSRLEKAGYRSATAHLSAAKCQHIGPHQKKVEPSTCRSWPTCPSRVICHVQKVQCFRGKALHAVGWRCARSSCPPRDACKSRSWVAQIVDVVCSISVTKPDPQALGKSTHTCAAQPSLTEVLCPVKVAMKLHRAATQHSPVKAHPLPRMRPLLSAVSGTLRARGLQQRHFRVCGVDNCGPAR